MIDQIIPTKHPNTKYPKNSVQNIEPNYPKATPKQHIQQNMYPNEMSNQKIREQYLSEISKRATRAKAKYASEISESSIRTKNTRETSARNIRAKYTSEIYVRNI
ncbi:hypothetical protein AC1031_014193 [Aphanomyces cochlioides]|nr:hypothetical protein AC1031_014193 [Aphanomyces cochlioides]